MKISQQFPQFKKERALVIVTGTQEAEFYLASNGLFEKIEMFRISRLHFSDNEGLSGRPGKTGVMGGSARSLKEQYQQEFEAKFKVMAKNVITRTVPTQLLIISPVIAEVEGLLPTAAKKLVTMRLRKNLCEHHGEEILDHIQKGMK